MNISQRLRTCAKHTGLDSVIELLQEAADEIDALQARAQVQGDPVGYVDPRDLADCHDTAIIKMAPEWHEGLRFKVPLYTAPQPAQATQAEVPDAEIEALFGKCGGHWSGDQWVIEDADLHPFARAILALRPAATFCGYCGGNDEDPVDHCMDCTRPAAVPMTPREIELIDGMIEVQLDHAQRCDAIGNRVMGEKQKGWDMERVELLRRIRSFGITAQAKKETP